MELSQFDSKMKGRWEGGGGGGGGMVLRVSSKRLLTVIP